MKRKMDLLERAHGLLCNAPGAGGAEHDHEAWLKLRAEWIDRWTHVTRDQQTKEHNRRVQVGNKAIADYQSRCEPTSATVPAGRAKRSPLASPVTAAAHRLLDRWEQIHDAAGTMSLADAEGLVSGVLADMSDSDRKNVAA